MNIDEFFKVFTGGNSNVATWTPKAIKEFAEDYHNQQLRLHGVSHCADELEPITANITGLGFTTPSDHGIIKLELPYQHYKIKEWKKGDKIEIKHCG